jgi:hypothetical protein
LGTGRICLWAMGLWRGEGGGPTVHIH